MLHDVAYSLLYRSPGAAQPFPVREARRAPAVSPWTGLGAALEQRWLELYRSSWGLYPFTRPCFRETRLASPGKRPGGCR